jgi:hypothetical protein
MSPVAPKFVVAANVAKDVPGLLTQADGVTAGIEAHPGFFPNSGPVVQTLTDGGGFGAGKFSIRSTGVDGQQVVDTFDWPSGGIAGAFLEGQGNFQ